MRIPPRTRLGSMRKATLTVNSPKVAPQLVRMAGLAIAVVAAEGDTGTVVRCNGASVKEVTAAALVGEVALGYVDAVQVLVSEKSTRGRQRGRENALVGWSAEAVAGDAVTFVQALKITCSNRCCFQGLVDRCNEGPGC